MYCGDETGAFVGDVGYSTSKFGYGGDDLPKAVIPSVVGELEVSGEADADTDTSLKKNFLTGQGAISRYQPNLELRYIHNRPNYDENERGVGINDGEAYLEHDGVIADWDAWEACWNKAFVDLRVRDCTKWSSPSQLLQQTSKKAKISISAEAASSILEGPCPHPICATQPGYTHYPGNTSEDDNNKNQRFQRQREKILERLFETFDAPAVFIIPSPAVSAFSLGRPTSLVVDVGGGGCRATPVVDGLLLRQSQRRSGRGGEWLSDQQYDILNKLAKQTIHPRYAVQYQRGGGSGQGAGDKKSHNDDKDNSEQSTSFTTPYINKKTVQYPTAKPSHNFHWNAMHELMYEMKTGPHVSTRTGPDAGEDGATESEDEDDIYGGSKSLYELPDGTTVDLKSQRSLRTIPVRTLIFVMRKKNMKSPSHY
jgi:hypothetical protein